MMLLFILFGYEKIGSYGSMAAHFGQLGLPLPDVAVLVAVIMELGVGLAIAAGVYTRPLAVLLAVYTMITALVGHRFWSMSGQQAVDAEINFFKNVSIVGGLLLLYVTGPGRFSIDRRFGLG